MENTAQQDITVEQVLNRDVWTFEEFQQFCRVCPDPIKLSEYLDSLQEETPKPTGQLAIKMGIMQFTLCRFAEALRTLAGGTDNKERRYFQGMCFMHLRRWDKAIDELDRAGNKGWDADEITLLNCELMALRGQLDEAEKKLSKIKGPAAKTAQYSCVTGLVKELAGFGDEAADLYREAIDLDDRFVPAIFRLAYYYDLHGLETEAIDLYNQCLTFPPVHINALLNLSVLYEDIGWYDKSTDCLKRILIAHPTHARAKLFLRDVLAAKTMYFDEDQARRTAKRNAVLDIPITDFELSVRARNCLKKMNIHTLGDLIVSTEAELLAYKNFGETSLKEIKDILASKALYLGQGLENDSSYAKGGMSLISIEPPSGADEKILSISIDQLELSVRARRAVDALGIKTIGEMAMKTEVELMSCKNFGQTSLVEIRQKLGDHNLSLREPK